MKNKKYLSNMSVGNILRLPKRRDLLRGSHVL